MTHQSMINTALNQLASIQALHASMTNGDERYSVAIDASIIGIAVLRDKTEVDHPFTFSRQIADGSWIDSRSYFANAKEAMLGAMAEQKYGLNGGDFGHAAAMILV